MGDTGVRHTRLKDDSTGKKRAASMPLSVTFHPISTLLKLASVEQSLGLPRGALDIGREPLQAFEQTLSCSCATT